jgi:hypothetical protein
MLEELKLEAPNMLVKRREDQNQFEARLQKRWGKEIFQCSFHGRITQVLTPKVAETRLTISSSIMPIAKFGRGLLFLRPGSKKQIVPSASTRPASQARLFPSIFMVKNGVKFENGPSTIRTYDPAVMSRVHCRCAIGPNKMILKSGQPDSNWR